MRLVTVRLSRDFSRDILADDKYGRFVLPYFFVQINPKYLKSSFEFDIIILH